MIHSRPQLVHHVSAFVDQWSGMATKLFCLQQLFHQGKRCKDNRRQSPMERDTLRSTWVWVISKPRKLFLLYIRMILMITIDRWDTKSVLTSICLFLFPQDFRTKVLFWKATRPDRLTKSARQSFAILDLWRNMKSLACFECLLCPLNLPYSIDLITNSSKKWRLEYHSKDHHTT